MVASDNNNNNNDNNKNPQISCCEEHFCMLTEERVQVVIRSLSAVKGQLLGLDKADAWPLLKHFLSDDYYFNNKGYICGYCTSSYTPVLPSISKFINPDEKGGSEGTDPNAPGIPGSRALLRLKKLANVVLSATTGKKFKDGTKDRPTNVVKGFGYSLMDFFENEGFDMSNAIKEDYDMYVEKTSPYSPDKRRKRRVVANEDTKKRVKDSDTMSRKSSRVSRRQIRKFQLVKIKSSVVKIPAMNAVCPFTDEEITTAKKCLINKLERPPDYEKRQTHYCYINFNNIKACSLTSERYTVHWINQGASTSL